MARILVIGGSSGIGFETVKLSLEHGRRVDRLHGPWRR